MRAIALASILVLSGCVSAPSVPPMQYYVLGDGYEAGAVRPASQRNIVLLINPTSVSTFYDTQRLVFSRAEGQRAYYQFAAWTERPGRAFAELLSRRLDAPLTTSGVRGDLTLHTRLEELYHDARAGPGSARVSVSAQLVDARGRLVADQRFTAIAPAGSADAASAVDAANRAISEVLDELAAWAADRRSHTAPAGAITSSY